MQKGLDFRPQIQILKWLQPFDQKKKVTTHTTTTPLDALSGFTYIFKK